MCFNINMIANIVLIITVDIPIVFLMHIYIHIHNPYSNWWVITGLPGGVLIIAKGNTWFGCWMHVLVFHLQRGILMLQDELFPENPIMSPFRIVFHGQIPMMRIWLEHHIGTSNPTETQCHWILKVIDACICIFLCAYCQSLKTSVGCPVVVTINTDDDLALIPEVCIYFRIRSYMKPTMVYQA